MAEKRTVPNSTTREAERAEFDSDHGPDRQASPAEEQAAERGKPENMDEVSENYREQAHKGAETKGEGRIP